MAAAVAVMVDQTLESRVARLESDVGHIRSDIADIKVDMREFRTELAKFRSELAKMNQGLAGGLASNRVWMLLRSGAILGVMARGFGWL